MLILRLILTPEEQERFQTFEDFTNAVDGGWGINDENILDYLMRPSRGDPKAAQFLIPGSLHHHTLRALKHFRMEQARVMGEVDSW